MAIFVVFRYSFFIGYQWYCILEKDEELGYPDEEGRNGPLTQTYIESWMNDMHFYRHFDGPPWTEDGDDNGDEDGSINVGGKNFKSKAIVDCFKKQTGFKDEIETRERSLASVKRARQKELKNSNKEDNKENLKPIKRDINIPEAITVRELANRMAEQSSNVI